MSFAEWWAFLAELWWRLCAFWVKAAESVRNFFVIVGGIVGLGLLWWRTANIHRQTETLRLRHEAQVKADHERRITDSFTRAVELLGSDKPETRLGAIYALERIARESRDDHWPIMETLISFVQRQTSLSLDDHQTEQLEGRLLQEEVPSTPAADVQAALTVIGRRRRDHDPQSAVSAIRPHEPIECGSSRSAPRKSRPLRRLADRHAFQWGGTGGRRSQGRSYPKRQARICSAQSGSLERRCLTRANLRGAVLETTVLEGASLRGACLVDTDLQRGVVGLTQEQLNEAYGDPVTTKLPEGMTIQSYRTIT